MDEWDWLKESLNKLETKVDKIDAKVDESNLKHERNTVILEEHQRRSLANEKSVEILRQEIKPLQKLHVVLTALLKMVGIVSLSLGTILTILKIVSWHQ